MLYALRDLRNAVAHNSVIFDTRFKTAAINRRLSSLLETETGIQNIDFNYISSYIILISYILKKLGSRKECKSFIHEYLRISNYVHQNLPTNVCFQILGTNNKPVMAALEAYVQTE